MTDITEWLTPQEASEEAGCSPSWITSLLNKGKLQGQRKGRTWLIHRDELQKIDGLRRRRAKVDVGQELAEVKEKLDQVTDVLHQLAALVVDGNRQGRATQQMLGWVAEANGVGLVESGRPKQLVDLAAGGQDDLDAELAATAESNADAAETQEQLV